MNELKELQLDLFNWAEKTFYEPTIETVMAHCKEEIDEVLADPTDIMEWADVLMIYLHGAQIYGYSIDKIYLAMLDKFEIIKKRDWLPPDEKGIIRHVKNFQID